MSGTRRMQDPKFCPKCSTHKPRSEFKPRSGFKNAVSSECKDCAMVMHKEWYAKNREDNIKAAAEWKRRNPERAKEQQREWKQANPERKRELEHRRRARKHENGVYAISPKDMRRLAKACVYCGSVEQITMDHVIPISRGGTHGVGNLVPACASCNAVKNARTIMEWRMSKARG